MATVDATTAEEPRRPLRADARRNRERILAVASAAFAEEGFDVGVAEIARRAGVGTGTLFRHFPTKRDLQVAAVLERSAEMRAAIEAAVAEPDPWRAFEGLMTRAVELTAADRCLGHALREGMIDEPRLMALSDEMLTGIETVLARGRAAGVIRADVAPEDVPVLASLVGSTLERFGRSQPELWRRYLGVVLDGLRPAGTTPLEPGPPALRDLGASCTSVAPGSGI